MLVHFFETTITTASNTGSANTLKFDGAEAVQFFVKSTTATHKFSVKLTDKKNRVVDEYKNIRGLLNKKLGILLRDIYTITITSVIDEAFTVFLSVKD